MRATAPIELDLVSPPTGDESGAPSRSAAKWPLVGLIVVAAVAVLAGRAQPREPASMGTVLRATGVFQCAAGAYSTFQIDVVNQFDKPVTLSKVAVEATGAPAMRAAFGPEGDMGPCRAGWSWPTALKRLTIAPDHLGVVFLAYPRVCQPAAGPVFRSVLVTVDVGGHRRLVRDITPDAESLTEVNANSSVICDT
jgi:hypothetical protein